MRYIKTSDKCEEFFHLFFNCKISGIRQKNDLKLAAFSQFTSWVTTNFKSFFCVPSVGQCKPSTFFSLVFWNTFCISELVTIIVKASRETFKTAVMKPLLQQSNLDTNISSNHRPISNLPFFFFSKVLDKAVFMQISDILLGSSLVIEQITGQWIPSPRSLAELL